MNNPFQFRLNCRIIFYNSADSRQQICTNFQQETFTSTQTLSDFLNIRFRPEFPEACWQRYAKVGVRHGISNVNELLSTLSVNIYNNGYNSISFFGKLNPDIYREYDDLLN